MSEKRFTTNGYYINDTYHDGRKWLVNEVEAEEIVDVMNGLDIKARESRKAISKLQKENEQLRKKLECCEYEHFLNELDEMHEKVDKGDLSDFSPLKEDKPLNDYNPL